MNYSNPHPNYGSPEWIAACVASKLTGLRRGDHVTVLTGRHRGKSATVRWLQNSGIVRVAFTDRTVCSYFAHELEPRP